MEDCFRLSFARILVTLGTLWCCVEVRDLFMERHAALACTTRCVLRKSDYDVDLAKVAFQIEPSPRIKVKDQRLRKKRPDNDVRPL